MIVACCLLFVVCYLLFASCLFVVVVCLLLVGWLWLVTCCKAFSCYLKFDTRR